MIGTQAITQPIKRVTAKSAERFRLMGRSTNGAHIGCPGMYATKLTVIVQQAEHPRRAHAHVGRRISREQRPDPIRRPRGAKRVHGMVADDVQHAVRSEVAEHLDAMRADRCGALVHQARGEDRQRLPLDQRPERLRLPTKNQGVRGLLAKWALSKESASIRV